jgi:hypothetical protein
MSKRYEVEELKRVALRLRQHLGMKDVLHLNMLAVIGIRTVAELL